MVPSRLRGYVLVAILFVVLALSLATSVLPPAAGLSQAVTSFSAVSPAAIVTLSGEESAPPVVATLSGEESAPARVATLSGEESAPLKRG